MNFARSIAECQQTKAQKLVLSRENLEALPKSLLSLTWLRSLSLRTCGLKSLPKEISQLTQLRSLTVSGNTLTEIPEEIVNLENLEILIISGNQISHLPENIGNLTKLVILDASSNNLDNLPESITELEHLRELILRGNALMEIPYEIGKMKNLQKLDLRSNKLFYIPESVTELPNLNYLGLSFNKISNLPINIGALNQLETLDLKGMVLKNVPFSLSLLTKLKELNLSNNPNLSIPIELLENPLNVTPILDYVKELNVEQPLPLTEIKILVVGEADVGKTTLIKRMIGEYFNIEIRDPTPGINIRDWTIRVQDRSLTLHFWDFGGQEIMHNTHRLFLTTRSCYLLILDSTQNEESNGIVKWLKTIHLYAPDAPVIIAVNKSDKFRLKLNLQDLQKHHPISGVVETSCATGEGIDVLTTTLGRELLKLPHLNELIPARWMAVRHEVSYATGNYLDYRSFQLICESQKVKDGVKSLAELLHALGVLFTYSDDPTLKLTHVLNPNWVTGGIYPILTDQVLTQKGGFVTDEDIVRVLDSNIYPIDKQPFILRMMFTFELAFEIKPSKYLVPDLLPKEPPFHQWSDAQSLGFIYEYDFLPAGLFSRFVVQMQSEVNPEMVWRSGVILHQGGKPYAKVVMNNDDKIISLGISLTQEDHRDPRTLLDVLRDKFEALHKTFPGLNVSEFVPIKGKNTKIAYVDLIYWESIGEYEQSSRKAGKFNVKELLNGISARHHTINLKSEGTLQSSEKETTINRRKQLLKILCNEFSSTKALVNFLEFSGLEQYVHQLDTTMGLRDVSQSLILTLEKAGMQVEIGRPALAIFLTDLIEKSEGQKEAVKFLREWVRELER